jgi:hypothetical protein
MGEFAAKFRPEVDLDEFERRLRAVAPAPQRADAADPLAELARLVGGDSMSKRQDPFESLFRARAAAEGAAHEAQSHAPNGLGGTHDYFEDRAQAENQHEQQAYADQAQQYGAEQSPYAEAGAAWGSEGQASAEAHGHGAGWPAAYGEQAQAETLPRFRRKVMYGMATALALGVLAIGGTLALRAKSGGSQDVATIQADADPAKVKPAQGSDSGDAQVGQALFDRKGNGNVAKVVASGEQPADLGVTVKNARVVGAASGVATPTPPSPAGAAAATPQAQQADSIFPAPKKVKTVAVRADGAVIDSANAPVPVPRALPTMAAGAPPAASAAPAPTRTPAAKLPDRATTTTEAALTAPARAPAAKEAKSETGGFAVQLAGTPSEEEARAAANALTAKYSSALQGHKATFAQAKVGDKTIYRVRIGHLTEDAAKTMCAAIKSQGGACFIAKN